MATLRLLDDVPFQAGYCSRYFLLLLLRHFELRERRQQVLNRDVPIFFGYAEPFMCGLHVAPYVHARPAGCRAQLIEYQLANPHLRIVARSNKKATKSLVGCKPNDEIIGHRSQRVVSAEPLVERVAALGRSNPGAACAR